MSLDYSYKNVVDSDTVMWDEEDHMLPEVQSIIFATIGVGISTITGDNYVIFYERYVRHSLVYGSEPYFTLALVKKMVGLSTNASPLTDAAFKKNLLATLDRRANLIVRKEQAEL